MKAAKQNFDQVVSALNSRLTQCATAMITVLLAMNMTLANAEITESGGTGTQPAIAAKVNGVPIEIDKLSPQVGKSMQKYKKYGYKKANEDLLKMLQKEALDKLISAELLYQEAQNLQLNDLDKKVAEKLNKIREQSTENDNFDENKIKNILAKQILIDEYLTKNNLKGSVLPEKDIKKYYEENQKSFKRAETVRSRHILVSVPVDANSDEKKEALKKIEKARKLVLDGTPFGEVSKDYSDCSSASSGGELGYQERGYMPKAYDDIAFSIETGKLSKVVETKHGYHILEVLDHKPAGILPYEDVKDFIGRYLNHRHNKKAMDEHLSALRKKAKIEIYL